MLADVPVGILDTMSFPYRAGTPFVEALAAAGGESRVDKAFRDPPRFGAEILHPELYLDDSKRNALNLAYDTMPEPQPDPGALTHGDVYGWDESITAVVLADVLEQTAATAAATAWNGALAIEWSTVNETCVRINFADPVDPNDTRLQAALQTWAARQQNATVTLSPLSLRSCANN